MEARGRKVSALWILTLVVCAVMAFVEPMAQDPAYHEFSDRATVAGIPNFSDVVSNLPFLLVGVTGLLGVRRSGEARPAWFVFFVGVTMVAFGSAWYHLDPTNETLVWDRLPMTLAFMALFAVMIGDRISPRAASLLLVPLLLAGLASVLWWHHTERQGAGDLRWYGLVQFYPMLAMPLMMILFDARRLRTRPLILAFASYGVAKLFELFDQEVHGVLIMVSGHTLKHVGAALATWFLYRVMSTART